MGLTGFRGVTVDETHRSEGTHSDGTHRSEGTHSDGTHRSEGTYWCGGTRSDGTHCRWNPRSWQDSLLIELTGLGGLTVD